MPTKESYEPLSVNRFLASRAVRQGMARTLLATIVDASGILYAVVLARIGGSSEALLVGVPRPQENDDHEPQERGHHEQDHLQDTRHGLRGLRRARSQSTRGAASLSVAPAAISGSG